jgi:hypothetical protein
MSRNESKFFVAVQVSQPFTTSFFRISGWALRSTALKTDGDPESAQNRFDLQDEVFHHVLVAGWREDQPSTLARHLP